MSILNDETIREYIENEELIPGGDVNQVKKCAYHCRPGKIFHTGAEGDVIDWGQSTDPPFIKIKPGEMVWIRARIHVKMPPDICAFWWQTYSLSRKGLMLVNMSMVEPGYEGPLACLFVNFGKEPVPVYPDTTMAKMVFVRLERPATQPSKLKFKLEEYDREVHDAANIAPTSFLQVAEFAKELTQDRDSAIELIKKRAAEEREQIVKNLQDDAPKAVRKSLGLAVAGFVLLVAAITFLPWLQSLMSPNLDDVIKSSVEKAVTERLVLQATPRLGNTQSTQEAVPGWAKDLEIRLNAIEERLRDLQREPKRP